MNRIDFWTLVELSFYDEAKIMIKNKPTQLKTKLVKLLKLDLVYFQHGIFFGVKQLAGT